MVTSDPTLHAMHWQLSLLDGLDVGLVVTDRQYQVKLWNSFMADHSGINSNSAVGQSLTGLFPDLNKAWFQQKMELVFSLGHNAFITWREQPFVFEFRPMRPFTSGAKQMLQDISIQPVHDISGEISDIVFIVYDVTDSAISKQHLEQANSKLIELNRYDALSGAFNRGYWEELLRAEFKRLLRTNGTASLLMLDIDHFKKINDTYGHQVGDQAIKALADTLRSKTRDTDLLGRYGGEEFGLILIDTDIEDAKVLAERLRCAIEDLVVYHDTFELKFTISIGAAEYQADFYTPEQWVKLSDDALYAAKEGGRNRVVATQAY